MEKKKIQYSDSKRKERVSQRVGQSTCSVCGETALPGSAVVVHYGKGGRIHKSCLEENTHA